MAPKHCKEDKNSNEQMEHCGEKIKKKATKEGKKLGRKICGKYFFEREEEMREWYEISTREKQGTERQ